MVQTFGDVCAASRITGSQQQAGMHGYKRLQAVVASETKGNMLMLTSFTETLSAGRNGETNSKLQAPASFSTKSLHIACVLVAA